METIRYIDATGGTTTLSNTTDKRYLGGNVDTWHVTPQYDQLVEEQSNFSGYSMEHTGWELHFAIGTTTYANARGALAAWRKLFLNDVSRGSAGTLEVVHSGGTYTIDAAIATPDVTGPQNGYIDVVLHFMSKSPFWVLEPAISTVSAFAGTAAVNVGYNNTGDFKTWPVHVITGAMDTPRMTNTVTGTYVEVGTVWAGAADQLWVWTDDPLIRYYAGGTAAGDRALGSNWTKYAGTASTWYALQVGAGTVQLSATSGSATYQLDYDIRKGGLG